MTGKEACELGSLQNGVPTMAQKDERCEVDRTTGIGPRVGNTHKEMR